MVNLGDVVFALNANTAGLDRAAGALNTFASKVESSQTRVRRAVSTPANTSWISNLHGLLGALSVQSTLALGPLSGVTARIQALNHIAGQGGVAMAALAGGIAGVIAVTAGLAVGAVRTAMMLQRVELSLKAVSGSAGEAGTELDFVREVANKSGLTFRSLAEGYASFNAAARAAHMSLKDIHQTFLQTSMAAGTLHLSVQDTEGVFIALQQIMSKGTVQSQELRQQLGNRFPGAFAIAAQAIGKTTRELDQMMRKGEVISSEFVPAFTKAMMDVYHIDVSKPIDTLQASLNRLSTGFMTFFQTIDQNIHVSQAFKTLVEGMGAALQTVGNNLPQILTAIATLGGAFAGATASVGAFYAVMIGGSALAGLGAAVQFFWDLVKAEQALTVVTNILTVAQIALDGAIAASGIGGLVMLVTGLAGAAIGAGFAMRKMNDMLFANNQAAARASSEGFQQYIDQQNAMLTKTTETTAAMIKQADVLLRQQVQAVNKTHDAYYGLLQTQQDVSDAAGTMGEGAFYAASPGTGEIDAAKKKWEDASRVYNTLVKQNQELHAIFERQDKMPDPMAAVNAGNLSSKIQNQIDKIQDMVIALNAAQTALVQLNNTPLTGLGTGSFNLDALINPIKDLQAAQNALKDTDPAAMSGIDKVLTDAGFKAGTIVERVAALIGATRQANQEFERTTKIVDDINNSMIQMNTQAAQLQALQKGMNPDSLAFFNLGTLAEAQKMLQNLSQTSLAQVRAALDQMGVSYTSDTEAVQQWLLMQEQSKRAVDDATEAYHRHQEAIDKLRQTHADLAQAREDAAQLGEAWLRGGSRAAQAMEQMQERARKVQEYMESVRQTGLYSPEQQDQMAKAYETELGYLDSQQNALDKLIERIQNTEQAWSQWKDTSMDALANVIALGGDLSDTVSEIGNQLKLMAVKSLITDPIAGMLGDIGGGLRHAAGNWLGNTLGNSFTKGKTDDPLAGLKDAAGTTNSALGKMAGTIQGQAISSLVSYAMQTLGVTGAKVSEGTATVGMTAAATAAATALSALAIAASAAAGAQGAQAGSNTVNALMSTAMTAANGGPVFGPGGPRDDMVPAWLSNGEFVVNAASTRKNIKLLKAINAGFSLGNLGRAFADGGMVGDSFPGWLSGAPNSPLNSNSGHTIIIGGSSIVVHGNADRDALEEARAYMDMRDAALRAELPYIIDHRVVDSQVRNRY